MNLVPVADQNVEPGDALIDACARESVRLLGHHVRRGTRGSDLYLSFVNLSVFGDEGDVFGNLLAILFGLSSDAMSQRTARVVEQQAAGAMPVRGVLDPLTPENGLWRDYMTRHQQNHAHQYHNGGIWPFVGSFWVMSLMLLGKRRQARVALDALARANSLDDWRFTEWFHGTSMKPMGMAGQSWNAATFLLARKMVDRDLRAF